MLRDLRYGLRQMAASPGISAIAVLALALGIGANTAIFSVVHAVLLRGLPVAHPERLVTLVNYHEQRHVTSGASPYADVCEWRRRLRSFESLSAFQQASVNVSGGDEPEHALLGRVNWNFFAMLGVRPALGRDFVPEEDRPGAGRVALLTHELWKRRFGASPNAIGASVSVDGEPYAIIGVLPERFRFLGQPTDLYAPLALSEAPKPVVAVTVYARLRPGVTHRQAQPELAALTAATIARLPRFKGWQIQARELREWIVPDVKASLWVLLGAVGLVLLIACANVAGLLLSRAAARRREIAVRAALGAGRRRLIRQLLTESAPLGLLGGALGLLLAAWGVQLLVHIDLARIPRLGATRVDSTVLAFTGLVSVLTCLLFGLAPALSFARADVSDALKEGARGGSGSLRGSRLRGALVVAEVALALLLSIGATLMIRTFYNLASVNPGFNPEDLLSASVDLPRGKYRGREQVTGFYQQLIERLQSLPGVQSASLTSSLPLGGNYFRMSLPIEGHEYASPREWPMLSYRVVDGNYLRTMQIPLRQGRFFTTQDRIGAPGAVIINETTARRFFPGRDPLGRRLGGPGEFLTVVGVVADIKQEDVSFVGPETEVLLSFAQNPSHAMALAVRLDPRLYPDPERFVPLVRNAVAAQDRNLGLYRIGSMEKFMADRLAPRRMNMILLCLFAGLAVVLAAIGIYGVLSFSVERRTHEIGVRVALGARDRDVIRLVVGQALALAGAGLALGIAAAAAFTRVLGTLLYGVKATDPWIFAGAAAVLLAVAALAGYLPARRAARVDPVVALRCE